MTIRSVTNGLASTALPSGKRFRRTLCLGTAAIALLLGACDDPGGSTDETEAAEGETAEIVEEEPLAAEADALAGFENLPRLEGSATVIVTVNGAPITIEVDGEKAPITAGNFVDLAEKGVYDGTLFHRVVRSPQPFVVQGGDPQGKDPSVPVEDLGNGSYIDESGEPRYVPLEILFQGDETPTYGQPMPGRPTQLQHNRGAVAMARSNFPNSASAQFYITIDNVNFLDGDYAVFGEVTEGMDVVDSIQKGDVIDSVTVIEGADNLKP